MLSFIAMALIGAASGYRVAQANWSTTQSALSVQSLVEQYELGVKDLNNGQFDIARQRFEYVLEREPAFPGAADKLAEAIAVLYATATPTPIPPTHTPTATQDLRPVEELFSYLLEVYAQGDWDAAIDSIVSLRQVDPNYRVVDVDGMLYRVLRNRGINKIRDNGNLEGGIYDLALVERIGPLDAEALTYRDLARYYMMGSGFWEVYPEQAVYYFGLVASASPYLRDASGWTAAARYQAALIQYADQLAREGEWCNAQIQYDLAVSYGGDVHVRETVEYAAYQCSPPTETPSPITDTPTHTVSPSPTVVVFITPTPTWTLESSPTLIPTSTSTTPPLITPEPTGTPTSEWTPSITSTPSLTVVPTQIPSATSIPVLLPTETATAVSIPTDLVETTTPSPTVENTPGAFVH